MKVGFIGAGSMGAPMIARLSAAYPGATMVFDIDVTVADRIARDSGARACATIAEIAAASDVLLSCVPNNASIREVYLGDGGVISAIRDGAITIDELCQQFDRDSCKN